MIAATATATTTASTTAIVATVTTATVTTAATMTAAPIAVATGMIAATIAGWSIAPRPVVVHRGPPRWSRGHRYYDPGYGRTYVVNDYYGYGLRQPPRGHYWRRSDAGDFLLVAVATGIIADLILQH
jgi:Ni/Co efflux regulator RcnB